MSQSTLEPEDPQFYSFDRMRSGKWFIPGSEGLREIHDRDVPLLKEINELANTDPERAGELFRELLSEESHVPRWVVPTFVEYGCNVVFGEECFVNVGMTILASAPVRIGAHTKFGPNCQLITVNHPVGDVAMRRAGWERATPITIGADCWFGAGVQVMPGVSVGDRCVIAAGAILTRDVPDDSLVAGVPGRVIRSLIDAPLEREELDF